MFLRKVIFTGTGREGLETSTHRFGGHNPQQHGGEGDLRLWKEALDAPFQARYKWEPEPVQVGKSPGKTRVGTSGEKGRGCSGQGRERELMERYTQH